MGRTVGIKRIVIKLPSVDRDLCSQERVRRVRIVVDEGEQGEIMLCWDECNLVEFGMEVSQEFTEKGSRSMQDVAQEGGANGGDAAVL